MYFTYFEGLGGYRNTAVFGRSESFHIIWGVSAPSLHRESTDSLHHTQKASPGGDTVGNSSEDCCWENIIGQELFKLNLTHLMADLCTMAVDMGRWALPRIPVLNKLERWVHIT